MFRRGPIPGGFRCGWSATSALLVGGAVAAALGLAGWKAASELNLWRDYRAAQTSLEGDDPADARARLERCLKAWPDDAEAHFLAARAARRTGDFAAASRELDAAARLQWVPEALDLERALLAAQRGGLRSVEAALRSWVAHGHPDRVLILEILTPLYFREFRLVEASGYARQWTELRPSSGKAWRIRGEIEERFRHKEAALEAFRHAAAADAGDVTSRLGMGRILLDLRQADEASGVFAEVLRLRPGSTEARVGAARCLVDQGSPDAARAALDEILKAAPNDPAALRHRGRLELEGESPGRAEPWLRKADALDPFDKDLLHDLSKCLAAQSKKDEALEVATRLKRCDEDFDRANELSRKILEKPGDAGLKRELAEVLARNGKPKEAARWLEAVVRDDPSDAAARRKLAEYYQAARDRRLAETSPAGGPASP